MTTNDLTDTVREALSLISDHTVSALAKAAGVSQSLLARIKTGERQASPAVARKVAAVLDRWGVQCARAAARVRQAQPRGKHERD